MVATCADPRRYVTAVQCFIYIYLIEDASFDNDCDIKVKIFENKKTVLPISRN